jgi:hypothetical protein
MICFLLDDQRVPVGIAQRDEVAVSNPGASQRVGWPQYRTAAARISRPWRRPMLG